MRTRLSSLPVVLGALVPVLGFTFTSTTPTQCGNLQVSWTGGQPPFVLEIIPVHGSQKILNVPASAFNNGAGSFSTQLQLAQEQQFVITMSDATGSATGGISPLLTVEAPAGGASCNTVDPGPNFVYDLDFALQQCRPYTFSNFPDAVQPVTIVGVVPGGSAVVLHPPSGSTQFVWNPASVPAGTSIIFVMSDAQNRTGGASDIKVSGSTSDSSCLNASSPSVTSSQTSSTTTSASSTRSSTSSPAVSPSSTPKSSGKVSGTTVTATIVGILIGLGVLAALGFFLFRRHRGSSSRRRQPFLNLAGDGNDSPTSYPDHHDVEPYPMSAGTPYEMARMESTASLVPSSASAELVGGPPTSAPAPSRKGDLGASSRYRPANFILHTDVDDIAPDERGFIELPPQYSESRAPVIFHHPSSGSSSQTPHPP
ncbi:hypothetical protein BC834DRAFT_6550 [Gloeopeniophorella convolvens]|nr:hypothetical protein BC834DRAFT_6550 [Gloeopeniophorella convolvens]